jgi:hypothetical protein
MKIDFTATLVDAEDKPVLENDKPANVLTLFKRAVIADIGPDGRPITGDEKYPRFELYMKLRSADSTTDFTLDEVQLLEKAVRVYPTLIAGQLTYLLHNKTVTTLG